VEIIEYTVVLQNLADKICLLYCALQGRTLYESNNKRTGWINKSIGKSKNVFGFLLSYERKSATRLLMFILNYKYFYVNMFFGSVINELMKTDDENSV